MLPPSRVPFTPDMFLVPLFVLAVVLVIAGLAVYALA